MDTKEKKPRKEGKLKPSSVKEAEMPKSNIPDVKLKFGEILIAPIVNGKEGDPFKVSNRTYKKYFSDKDKFIVKKKFK